MPTTHPKFRAAAVQAAPVFLDLDAGIDKALTLIEEAAKHGAKLIAFPETWLPGYPWFIWLDSPAWGMQFIQRYHDNSLVYGSPQAERLSKAAKDNAIMVVMGLSEKAGGSLYMGQWIIDAEGRTVATRRKLKPTHVERTIYGEGDGSDLYCDVPIRFSQAALGAELIVPTLQGEALVKVPAETQTGKVFRLRGKGVKSVRSNSTGDLLCRVTVETPVKLTARQRELMQEFEATFDGEEGAKHSPKSSSFFDGVKSFLDRIIS